MSDSPGRIYFDACCVNRPFDDQSQARIRLETEAIEHLLRAVEQGKHVWVSSDALRYELANCAEPTRRHALLALCACAVETVAVDAIIVQRAGELRAQGLRELDALHLACAEHGHVDVVLTTDDQFIGAARRLDPPSVVRVVNPVVFETELFS